MSSPQLFRRIDQCLKCPVRSKALFCNLPEAAIKAMDALKITTEYPKGSTLFREGEVVTGVYIICYGRVKLSTTSVEGKQVILRLAEPGEVVGLHGLLTTGRYDLTVETTEPTQANFFKREDFMRLLRRFPDASLAATRQLVHNCTSAYDEIRSFAFSGSMAEKLARLILQFSDGSDGQNRVRLRYTQEEMAEMIGCSRESVSRQMGIFRQQGLIRVNGSMLTIVDRRALEDMVT